MKIIFHGVTLSRKNIFSTLSLATLTKELKKAVDDCLEGCKATKDFQTSRVYEYHADLNEKTIKPEKAREIVKRLDRLWRIKTIALFPEKWGEEEGCGWALSKRQAAIQLHPKLVCPSYVIHEHSHGVVECFRNFHKQFSGIREPGHGPLFCGVMAFSIHWITGQSFVDIEEQMRYYSLRVLDKNSVLTFKRIFKS